MNLYEVGMTRANISLTLVFMTLTSQLTHKHLANPIVDLEFQVQPKSTPAPHMILFQWQEISRNWYMGDFA